MFIDIHCHILPGVDDGADSYDEAKHIVSSAFESGTSVMVVSPHINNSFQGKSFVTKNDILEGYSIFKKNIARDIPGIKLFLGCELLVKSNIESVLKNKDFFTINGSRYILTEFLFDENFDNVKNYLSLIKSYGYIPVVAHPERYDFFKDNKYNDLYLMASKGILFQINKDSPLGKYGDSALDISRWLLKNDLVHIIAGDSHGATHRNADMTDIYEWLINYYSVDKINTLLHDNPKKILLDLNI